MLIFIADGRLGNQLFQYAFLKTVANPNEKILTFNMEMLTEVFDIHDENFKNIKLNKYFLFFLKKVIKPLVQVILVKPRLIGLIKQEIGKDGLPLPSYVKLDGIFPIQLVESDFYQSEYLFNKEDLNFKIKKEYLIKAQEFLGQLPPSAEKVFVHVRRGDYLQEYFLGSKGINLPKDYYLTAINSFKKELKNPFFVFLSDDPEFVECCFKDIENKIISKNDYGTDLAIMTQCEYGIMSNSTFSWWGAYLMENRKKVFCPKYWYGWKSKLEFPRGIIPVWCESIEI